MPFFFKTIHLRYFFLSLILFNGIINFTFAQNGNIAGTVLDKNWQETLPGASILIKGTNIGTSSDFSGNFIFRNIQPGTIILVVTFMGYESAEIEVTVESGLTSNINIELESSIQRLTEIVVMGSLEGQQRALNQQRTSDNIKNIISSDLIGRFPDLNVAEALQRVPGVNILREKGEGSTISIRGTPQHFTNILINNEKLPSVQEGGGRNEGLDLISADQLASMEITKAPTPDMDGDAIGGTVNLKTPKARGTSLRLRGESVLGYNDISGGINGMGRLRISRRFLTDNNRQGKLGVLASASYYSTDNAEHRTDGNWLGLPVPIRSLGVDTLVMRNYQYRYRMNERERIGVNFTLDYLFDDNHEIILNYMYNRRDDNDVRNRLRFDMDRSGTVYETLDSIREARVRRYFNIWNESKENHSLNLQGFHTIKNWQIDWSAFYALSERIMTSDRGDFAHDGIDIIADNPGGIFADIPKFRQAHGQPDVYDPFLYSDFRRYEEDNGTTNATNLVGRIDFSYDFTIADKYRSQLKFGGKVSSQTNSKLRDNKVLRFFDPNNILNISEAFLRVLSRKEPKQFIYSDYRFGPLAGVEEFQNYINSNRRLLTTSDDAWDALRLSLSDTYDAFEDVLAGYAMIRTQMNRLMLLAGIRVEHNDVRYDAFEVFRFGTDVIGTPISGTNTYTLVLPNVHMRYSLSDFTLIRFAALFNYARPNFVDIVPFVNYDSDAISLRLGNPELRPAEAFNLDLMLEHYFANVGILSIGGFYKNIDKFPFTRIEPSLIDDFPGYPNTQGFRFRQEQNGENAKVAGLEINFIRALDFLPGILSSFNLESNYTYTWSDAFTQDRFNISLPGQAKHTWNAALSFDYNNFSGRFSANYNGTFISSLASDPKDDIFQLERMQIDANASYNVKKRWRIFGEFVNITNAPSIRYQGSRERISRIAYFGWYSRIGLGFRF